MDSKSSNDSACYLLSMRKKTVSNILSVLCILLVGNSIFYFVVPSESDAMILEGNFGIVDNLKVPFHAHFWERSQNQSIDISLYCSEGRIDLVVLEFTEWESWYNGSEYTALYEWTNTSHVDTVVQIDPSYKGIIDIFFSTAYGDANMVVSIYSRSISYDDTTAVYSLIGAFSLGLVLVYHHKKPKKIFETQSVGPKIS
ncbi:MAG: hypothetical protein RTV31_03550 [Candidatus Thorarchaeota archaeon]